MLSVKIHRQMNVGRGMKGERKDIGVQDRSKSTTGYAFFLVGFVNVRVYIRQ